MSRIQYVAGSHKSQAVRTPHFRKAAPLCAGHDSEDVTYSEDGDVAAAARALQDLEASEPASMSANGRRGAKVSRQPEARTAYGSQSHR